MFNTVLMHEQMTEQQKRLFHNEKSPLDNAFAYLVNDDGTILRTILKENNGCFATANVNVSNWLFYIGESNDNK